MVTAHPASTSRAAASRPISPLPITRARFPDRPPVSRASRSTALWAAERGTPVRRTLVLRALPAAAAERNRVSSTPSAVPASRAAEMAPFTWVRI